jgi:hypothetical protein
MAVKNTRAKLGWLLMVHLGRRLIMSNYYGILEGFAYVVGTGEEPTAQESVRA